MILRFNLLGKRIGFSFDIRNQKKEWVTGYTNRCKDGMYVICLDLDNVELEWIEGELRRLQEDFELGTFYIFRSSENSYHAVCLDKVLFVELISIMESSTVDPDYLRVPLKWGKKVWTLRLTPKDKEIEFVKAIRCGSSRKQSLAHGLLLEKVFGVDVPEEDALKSDWSKEICFVRYPI